MDNLTDEKFMKEALIEAKRAYGKDEVPVGAVIVKDNKIIAKAFNLRQTKRQACFHAEILAINKACKRTKDFRLNDSTIFVTLEPCPMCMGAILNARISRLVYGASINKTNALSASEINEKSMLNFKTEITGGVLEKECGELVTNYFKNKRVQN